MLQIRASRMRQSLQIVERQVVEKYILFDVHKDEGDDT